MHRRCTFCSTTNIDPDVQIIGYRNACDECRKTKQPLPISAMKANKKRVLNDFRKKNQVKRKISDKSPFDEGTILTSANSLPKEDANQEDEPVEESANNSSLGDETSMREEETTLGTETLIDAVVSVPQVTEDIFLYRNLFLEKFELDVIDVDGEGDCCPLACLNSYLNQETPATAKQQAKLSTFKWSISNMVSQGRTTLEGKKYNSWRRKKVGDHLPYDEWLNTDDISVIAHYLNRQIIVMSPLIRKDNKSGMDMKLHVPIKGKDPKSNVRHLTMDSEEKMHYINCRRKREKSYMCPKKLVESGKGFIIQFHGGHYQAVLLRNKNKFQCKLPDKVSFNIFDTNENRRCCPICSKISWNSHPVIECCLCDRWIHSQSNSECLTYWDGIDVNGLSLENKFFCSVCINTLITYCKDTFNTFDTIEAINCLKSFNLDEMEELSEENLEILQIVIRNAIEKS